MKFTQIEIKGDSPNGHYAKISRKPGSEYIDVEILTPALADGRMHHVLAGDREDVLSMAECLQAMLDDFRGSNSMVHDYYCALQYFMD